jgi:23S rRNA (cytidine1920-2'-O)/16S rRNA (cytidine1409-2'-O)-methyltransferase
MVRTRLDALLVERGLYGSRSRAAAAVMAGEVRLAAEPSRMVKPGQFVDPATEVLVTQRRRFVSRGGVKLANGLDAFRIDPSGRRALDVGASTGGFTDCLLQRGATAVTAVDVGRGELDWGLRNDPRVTVLERQNARFLELSMLPYEPTLIVVDVSFISLSKVLPTVLACAAPTFDCLALVKPQFEVGPGKVSRGGVVREASERRAAFEAVGQTVVDLGRSVLGYARSGLPGPAGNREAFVWIGPAAHPSAVTDLRAATGEAEP